MSIRYKFANLLTEGYNFTNTDEVIEAIKANKVGVKIYPWAKQEQGSVPKKLALNNFFKRCEEMGIKDTTYGIQLLLSKCKTLGAFRVATNTDGLYEFLKSYKKPWVKQLPEYKKFIESDDFNLYIHPLEKAIQEEQSKHGKAIKGGGALQDVKVPYDDGTWKLLIPSSFEGEKAAAYYTEDGVEKPTHWCTRANKYYYDHYTSKGPLYIIRNLKTGKSYQLAFMEGQVEFLDQNDVKGDEIAEGDLSKIPDELLKHIKDPMGGKTLYDFKHRKSNEEEFPHKKGKLHNRESSSNPLDKTEAKYGPVVELGNGVCKKEVTNFSLDLYRPEELSDFFHWDGAKYSRIPIEYGKKDKATVYFLKNKPNSMMALVTGKDYSNKNKRIIDGTMYQKNWEALEPNEQYKIETAAEKDFGVDKHNYREENNRFGKGASKIAAKFNDAYMNNQEKIIERINKSHIFDNSPFKALLDVSIARYKNYYASGRLAGETLPERLTLRTKKGIDVDIYFRGKANDGETTVSSTYNKADRVAIVPLTDDSGQAIKEDSGEIFKVCKAIAREVMKQIIRMPEYKYANSTRREEAWVRGNEESKQDAEIEANDNEEVKSKRQIRRRADDLTRRNHNETYKDSDSYRGTRYHGSHYHGTHTSLHEEVNYFQY